MGALKKDRVNFIDLTWAEKNTFGPPVLKEETPGVEFTYLGHSLLPEFTNTLPSSPWLRGNLSE